MCYWCATAKRWRRFGSPPKAPRRPQRAAEGARLRVVEMTDSRRLLQHFLAALAYRTQKALRGAPPSFGDFRAGTNVRTPHELLWHMTGVIGYARTFLHGGPLARHRVDPFPEEIVRLHETPR